MSPGLPPASDDELQIGRVVGGRYRVEKRLGKGGMGAVYCATQIHMRKAVALKVLHHRMTQMPEAVARFEREAVAAARIQHPNVAAAIDFGRLDDDTYYLALEYVEGHNLRQVLYAAGGSLPVGRVLRIGQQLAEAMAAAHAQDIVHRDLKPENVMMLSEGAESDALKVLDFGLAKIALDDDPDGDAPTQLTKVGTIFGTPTYMSPEQAAAGEIGPSSDLYSLGVLLYEMLAGKPPFAADSVVVLLSKHINERPAPPPRHVPPRLARLVLRLLEKRPEARPASAGEVAADLQRLQSGLGSRALGGAAAFTHALRSRISSAWHGALARNRQLVARMRPLVGRAFRRVEQTIPQTAVLRRSVPIGAYRVSVGLLLGLMSALAASSLCLWMVLRNHSSASRDIVVANDEPSMMTIEADEPQRQPQLDQDQRSELEDIEALPVYKRTVTHWLTMGRLATLTEDWPNAVFAYRNAVQLDKKQARDPILLGALRAAAEHRESYEAAINSAVNLLGEPGMDLLFDLWSSVKDDRRKRPISELAESRLRILRLKNASAALQVRLELEFAKPNDCDSISKLLARALRSSDARSAQALEALRQEPACSANQPSGCSSCSGGDDDLEAAINEARAQRAPRFEAGRYVPAP